MPWLSLQQDRTIDIGSEENVNMYRTRPDRSAMGNHAVQTRELILQCTRPLHRGAPHCNCRLDLEITFSRSIGKCKIEDASEYIYIHTMYIHIVKENGRKASAPMSPMRTFPIPKRIHRKLAGRPIRSSKTANPSVLFLRS